MKIAVFEAETWERRSLEALQYEQEITFIEERLTEENADNFADAEILPTFIYSDLGEGVLKKFEKRELIAVCSTGFDHVDAGHCERRASPSPMCRATATTRWRSTSSPCCSPSAATWSGPQPAPPAASSRTEGCAPHRMSGVHSGTSTGSPVSIARCWGCADAGTNGCGR
jgi:hypothetical protein